MRPSQNIWNVLKYIIIYTTKSFVRYFIWITIIFNAIYIPLTALWWFDALGPECRYYGSYVERCTLLSWNIDEFTKPLLTIWVMPFIGPIGGIMMTLIAPITFTGIIGPIIFAIQSCIKIIKFFAQKSLKTTPKEP